MIETNKTIRKDKLKNKAEVAKALIVEPLLTDRQVAEKTGMGKSSANRAKLELGQDGTKEIDIMKRILETDDAIIDLVNQYQLNEIIKTIEDGNTLTWNEKKILGDLANNSTKRKAIFGDTGNSDKTVQFIIS